MFLSGEIFAIGLPCRTTCIVSPSSTAENNADASFLNSVKVTLLIFLYLVVYIMYVIVLSCVESVDCCNF